MITSVNATSNTYVGGMKTVGAGGTAASNKAALQAALNTGRSVHIPYGSYYLEGPVYNMGNGQIIFGQGPYQTILICSGDSSIFHSNGKHAATYRDFLMNGLGGTGPTNGYAIELNGTPDFGSTQNQAMYGSIQNVLMNNMSSGVGVFDMNVVSFEDLNMQNMHGYFGVYAEGQDSTKRIDNIKCTRLIYSASQTAKNNSRGTALAINGYVHSIQLYNFQAVGPYAGINVYNDFNLPYGQFPAFLLGHDVEIDFPVREALRVTHIDRVRMVNSYFHGSQQCDNIVLGQNVRDAKIIASNVSGAWRSGIYADNNILDITATEFDWNGQETPGVHHNILLGPNAQNVRIMGGGGDHSRVAYGICKSNSGTWVQHSCADAIGPRNF